MRLGLLGPANDDLAGLARAAAFLLNEADVTRAIYLGADDALDEAVTLWAESLVGPNPSDAALWDRALSPAIEGTPGQIDAFVRSERARLRLKSLEGLAGAELRCLEMFGDRVAVLVHDKALLDEEDIASSSFLIYGAGEAPLAKKIGPRWFLTPGPIGAPGAGAAVMDDSGDEVVVTFHDLDGRTTHREVLRVERSAKLSVNG